MENPYWHEFYKPHAIDFDEVRASCFEAFTIVATSRSLQGLPGDEVGGPLHEYFWRTAEVRLSKALLNLAIKMRTFEDTIAQSEAAATYDSWLSENYGSGELGLFGERGKPLSEWKDLHFREACNKIIHAIDVRPTYDNGSNASDDDYSWGMTGVLELQGSQGRRDWEAWLTVEEYICACVEIANQFKPLSSREQIAEDDNLPLE